MSHKSQRRYICEIMHGLQKEKKKTEHVVDFKMMLFGCEASEKLFSNKQRYFLESKR